MTLSPSGHHDPAVRDRLTVPSRGDAVAAAAVEFAGGPTGRYAAVGRHGLRYAVAVLSALASVLVALGVLQKNHCVRSGWSSPGSLWRACYSDLPIGLTATGGPWASGGPGHNQPVLTAVLQWAVREITPASDALGQQQRYFAFAAVIIAVLIGLTVAATAAMLPRTPWLAAHVALSPVLITAALVSFDVFGVCLATLGMAAWYRRRPELAGVLLGLATMARTYPLVLVAAIALIALRDGRRAELTRLLIAAAGAIAVSLGIAFLWGGNPFQVYGGWLDAAAAYGSPWFIPTMVKHPVSATTATGLAMIGWAAAIAVGVYLTRRPARQTPLAPLALTMLVIVLATGKALPVQACLWVLPLLALCAVRWRDHLVWAGVEIVYFVMVWMYAAAGANPGKGLPSAAYTVFLLVRLIAYAGLAWLAWETAEELDDHLDPEGAAAADAELAAVHAEHRALFAVGGETTGESSTGDAPNSTEPTSRS
ncbi:DUF2029 domain-containing protein [Calidifontibacter sp. DB0510]|uniref:DUF2029 domain-containing protein n=1 Tax=Metallococcus carri TaxID=1656884 RepID=A0A967B4T2_9MICO|nr:glycosyltransferase 87 family protein [Metallococcus carri]NHN57280.1 DUF2029 domain-containing protein [Metallococcus carri]NOP38115.1 DUF2029 domain-containing protein [Calidifontibacter sp. DB2511S]